VDLHRQPGHRAGNLRDLAEAGRRHFGGSLAGRLVVTAGLGGMGGAQPLAAAMNDAVMIAVEVDPDRIRRRLETRYVDRSVNRSTKR
jgi:urocanate hydratase